MKLLLRLLGRVGPERGAEMGCEGSGLFADFASHEGIVQKKPMNLEHNRATLPR